VHDEGSGVRVPHNPLRSGLYDIEKSNKLNTKSPKEKDKRISVRLMTFKDPFILSNKSNR
jgi:hypothetical protein